MLCFATLVSASFAWITLSSAPEITGIHTQVGANGSLEIALLNADTYLDPSGIRTGVGDSQVVQEALMSNLSWGNVIDLSDPAYGLDQISMTPAQLNVTDAGVVRSGFLSTAQFGLDGRVERIASENASAAYSELGFVYDAEKQSYGVRGIGALPQLSPQQSALTNAQSMVGAYISTATGTMEALWNSHGHELMDIFLRRYLLNSNTFSEADVTALRNVVVKAQTAYDYVDAAMRQGIIGYAAAQISDPDLFRTLRDNVENTMIPLSMLLDMIPASLPAGYSKWIGETDSIRTQLKQALVICNSLRGKEAAWDQISPVVEVLINGRKAYLGNERLGSSEAFAKLAEDTLLALPSEAGVLGKIADYIGNYSVLFDFNHLASVEARTTSTVSRPYLSQVAKVLDGLEIVEPDKLPLKAALEDICGFAIDLAFRSNADTQLLLQTDAAARIDDGSNVPETYGSYMRFSSDQLSVEQMVLLMDAIRIGFLDNQNRLLAVGKMNTSNYVEEENGVRAAMYLYAYEISTAGALLMGERRVEDTVITDLLDGTAMTITVVVWLDGEYVANSLAGIRDRSVQGALNLQFASSVNLNPAQQTVEKDN